MQKSEALIEATTRRDIARLGFDAAISSKARREAAEELEFWTNKVAFLSEAAR